jgi:hypothetical protein
MPTTAAHLDVLLVRELRTFAAEIESFPDDVMVWATVPGVSNSAGNLALHVCGNLQHYVGVVLGGTSYVRDRDLEFGRRTGTRSEIVREIESTARVVHAVLPTLDGAVLARDYPEVVAGRVIETGVFLTHLCAHLAMHLGQAGYLRRMLTGEARSTTPVPLSVLGRASS